MNREIGSIGHRRHGLDPPRHQPLGKRDQLIGVLNRLKSANHRIVAGSLGPTGQLIEPYGLLNREAAVEAYGEQARALAEGGVDLLVLETIFAVEEAVWAVEGIQSVTDLPLVVSFSFDMGTRTMMGLSPTDAVAAVAPLGIAAVAGWAIARKLGGETAAEGEHAPTAVATAN